ncbi:MAG: tetratricopeptide repeat protein [Polyangiaceae bacterium]|nr:tetratricopeptide repeat protein [Polyangiaceae bacterium]
MDRHKLDGLTREELVALASELGIVRPRSLTVPELIDEIISRTASSEREKARSRGWLGRARSLLASVIERGLHLPDVAKALRNAPSSKPWPVAPPPLATMTLAEIYAAQGHLDKALHVLDEILAREPEHADARSLRQRLDTQNTAKKRPEAPSKRDDVSAPIEAKTTVETKEAVANEPAPPVAFAEAPEAVEAPSPAAESAPATVEPEAAAAPSSAAPDTDKMPPVQSAPEEPSAAREVDQQEAPVEEPAEKNRSVSRGGAGCRAFV